MSNNEERRAVAARLRELPIDMYEVEELWEMKGLDTCCKDQTDYYLIHFVLFGCFPADHMRPCDYEELHARLADLIEPEERTCRNVSFDFGRLKCSACGKYTETLYRIGFGDMYADVPNYCPNCGAKLVVKGGAEVTEVRHSCDMGAKPTATMSRQENDTVASPAHYTQGGIECIDAMESAMPRDQFEGYLRGNVFKYLWRYDRKNGVQDLEKARWYLDKLIKKLTV